MTRLQDVLPQAERGELADLAHRLHADGRLVLDGLLALAAAEAARDLATEARAELVAAEQFAEATRVQAGQLSAARLQAEAGEQQTETQRRAEGRGFGITHRTLAARHVPVVVAQREEDAARAQLAQAEKRVRGLQLLIGECDRLATAWGTPAPLVLAVLAHLSPARRTR